MLMIYSIFTTAMLGDIVGPVYSSMAAASAACDAAYAVGWTNPSLS